MKKMLDKKLTNLYFDLNSGREFFFGNFDVYSEIFFFLKLRSFFGRLGSQEEHSLTI